MYHVASLSVCITWYHTSGDASQASHGVTRGVTCHVVSHVHAHAHLLLRDVLLEQPNLVLRQWRRPHRRRRRRRRRAGHVPVKVTQVLRKRLAGRFRKFPRDDAGRKGQEAEDKELRVRVVVALETETRDNGALPW